MAASLTFDGDEKVATFVTDGASQTTPTLEFKAGDLAVATVILNPGSAHAITLEVSNDGSTWVTAKDVTGTAVTKATTGAGLFELSSNARYMRVTSAASSTGSTTTVRWS